MKTIRKKFLLLAFAAGAMFVIGNNVFADPTVIGIDPGDGGGNDKITCNAMWKWGRKNRCYIQEREPNGRLTCTWTGRESDICNMP